jgi:hypothetical protein
MLHSLLGAIPKLTLPDYKQDGEQLSLVAKALRGARCAAMRRLAACTASCAIARFECTSEKTNIDVTRHLQDYGNRAFRSQPLQKQ